MVSTTCLIKMLETLRDELGNPEMPMQQILIYAYVVDRKELPMADLMKLTQLAQSSISRNVAKLGRGESPREPGYGLIEATEDPYYRKRKLVRLTPRGAEVSKIVSQAVARWLRAA